ncbi:hypothetical protein Tco_1511944 [Tanacetum coccineum]
MVEDVKNKNSNVLDSDEPVLLNTPLSVKIESSDPEDEINEINAFLAMEVSSNCEEGYFDSEGDVIFLENLLSDDTTHNLAPEISTSRSQENVHANPSSIIESLPVSHIPVEDSIENDDSEDEDIELPNNDHQDNPSSPRPPPEPPDVCLDFKPNTAMNDEDFNQGEIVLSLNVEDINSFTFVIWTFLPFFTYSEDSPVISLSEMRTSFLTLASLLFIFLLRQFHLLSLRTNNSWIESSLRLGDQKQAASWEFTPCLSFSFFFLFSNK